MSIVSISLVLLSTMITVRFLRFVLETGREENVPPPHPGRVPGRVDHLRGRILFVSSRDGDLVLDCVTVAAHPAFCALPPGTPFTLAVDPKGPPWLLEAVATMVSRWAAEDTVVDFDVVSSGRGERVDVRGERSRMLLDVRAHDGLG